MSSIQAGGRNPYYGRFAAQQAAGPQQAAAPERTARPSGAAEAAAPPPAEAAPLSEARDLSAPERQMIARQFPESPALSMRLYGPGRAAQTVRPDAVGGRLDVQG